MKVAGESFGKMGKRARVKPGVLVFWCGFIEVSRKVREIKIFAIDDTLIDGKSFGDLAVRK